MSRWSARLGWALLVLTWASSAAAQAVYGSLSGTVTDDSGAVLPGTTITITSVERKTVDVVVSNDSGFFVKDRLLPGLYEVKAELDGFKMAIVPSVTVSVDTQTPVSFRLEVGVVTEEVTVTGGAPLLKTDRADVATTFEARQLTDLPVLDRNFTKFLLLTPGTQNFTWQQNAAENPQGSVQIQVNGQHFSGTGYQLDGTENRDPILGIIVINPSLESVAEAKVTSQNYDAEFGQAVAGVVSVRTKSGSNQLSGSVFEFYRSDAQQARNPFTQFEPDPVTGRFVPETSHHQFGGAIGGPILRNRWFFFGDYQGTRDKQGGSQLLSVPTEAARRGDLRAYDVDIFDPTSATSADQRAQFANNAIPEQRLSPQAQAILDLMPTPNTAGVDNGTRDNFVASGSQTFDENSINVRVDGRLSDQLNTFGRYSTGDFFTDGPTALGQGGGAPLGGNLGGVSDVRNHSLAYGLDYTFSPSLLADFRFGFFRYNVNVLPFDFGTTPARDAGIPGLNLDETFTSSLPAFFLRANQPDMNWGSGLGVNGCNCPLDQDEKQWQLVGNVTKLAGRHTVKVGVDVRRAYNLRVPSDSHRSGELTFQGQRTSGGADRGGGLGLATFLLGDVTSFRRYFSEQTDARERQWRHFYYAQDTWRVNSQLTLNYGVRLDIINPQTVNEAGNGGYLDFETGEIVVAGVAGVDLAGNVENAWNWAPRLGATYQLDERTVLRAGYGRSYDIGVFGSLFGHSVTQNLPVLAVQALSAPSDFESVFTLAEGPPAPTFPDASDGRFALPDGVQSFVLPEKQRLPAVDAFNVTVQRQITDTMSVEVGYVGNRGRRVFADGPDMDPNQPTLEGFGTVPRDLRRPFFAGLRTPVENLGGAFGWTQNFRYYCNCANNWYDSLQTRFTKRFSGGYLANVNYTWQRAEQESGEYFFWDRDLNHGPPDWDRAHTLVVSGVAELPFGRNQRYLANISPVADLLVGGWQVNMNYTWTTGRPFNVGYRDSEQDRDTGPGRPDLIGDPSGPKTQDEWFNATPIGAPGSAFGRPEPGTFGNLPRNALRGPQFWQADASLFKSVRLPNEHLLEVRFEAVNVFNHTNLGLPDATVGVPGNDNPNAGRISSTSGPQRFVQFGLRYRF